MRRIANVRSADGAHARPRRSVQRSKSGGMAPGANSLTDGEAAGVTALSESALHITVYELLAHAYNRVAIQYHHDSGAATLMGLHRLPTSLFAPALPPHIQRQVVAAMFADAARALATFFGFEEMNFILLDHEQRVYRLVVREGPFFPYFQPGSYQQPFGTGILGQCHLERRTILFNDVTEAREYVRTDPTVRAELCVPVVLGDEVLAIIDTGASRVNALSDRHASFIEGFARYLAPAITDPWSFLQTWRPAPVQAEPALMPLAQPLNFLYAWHEEWRSRFAQLYLDVAQRNAELLAITDLSESLSSTLRLDTILSATVTKVAQLLSCEMSWILLPDVDGRLRMRALHGGSVGELADAGIASDGSPQFAVFSRGEPIITNVLEDPLLRTSFDWAFCSRNGITRFLTAPLRTRERIIGVMNVGRTNTAEDFTERDVRLLSTFANQIALYIENADLYEQSRLLGAVEERNRLARDLHDTLVQSIVGILHSLDQAVSVSDSTPPALQSSLTQARALAVQSLDEARRSIWNLHPAELAHKTLWEALSDWVDLWSQRTGITAKFRVSGSAGAISPDIEADVLRVGQEALGNVARHAHATHVDVSFEFSAAGLRLTVADDGVGFDPAAVDAPPRVERKRGRPRSASDTTPHKVGAESLAPATPSEPLAADGFGLRGMRERAKLMGGWLQVESAPGWGARVLLTVPVVANTSAAGGATADASGEPTGAHSQNTAADAAHLQAKERAALIEATEADPALMNEPAVERDDKRITIVVADDHPSVRDGLRLAFADNAGFHMLGSARSAQEAIDLTLTLHPDVLLLDMQFPDSDGLTVLARVRASGIPTRVVMLTAHLDDAHIAGALQGGAAGYLEKGIETRRLLEAVQAAAGGRQALSPGVITRLQTREGLLVNVAAERLTRREQEVLELLAAGLSYGAIARQLFISVATVKFHTIHLYQKLHSSARTEALNHAREWGLLR